MYNGAPFSPQLGEFDPNNAAMINALSGTQPQFSGVNPQTQALMSAISGQAPQPVQAPPSARLWGSLTPSEGAAEVSAGLPGLERTVSAKQERLESAKNLSPEAPALSFMGMPVVSAREAKESAERDLAEAQAKKAHAEAQLAGEAALPTTTPLRNAAETAFQSVGTSYASVPKFAGYIGGWLANEAGADIHPTDNAVFRLGDQADKWAKSAFPGDPARADEFGTKAAHLTGFLASLYGAGGARAMAEGGTELAAKIGAAVTKASQASIAASTGGMGQFEGATEAMEAGKEQHPMAGVTITPQGMPVSERDRAMATMLGAGVGLTGLIPMASAMATSGEREIGAILAEALKGSGVNASQMAAFGVLNNAIAREYYDPERSLTRGVEDDAALGALVGGVSHGASTLTGAKRLSTPEEVHETIDAARKSDPDLGSYWRDIHEQADRKLSEAGPYALRNRTDWREEAHGARPLPDRQEGVPDRGEGQEAGAPGRGGELPGKGGEAPAPRPVVGTETFGYEDKHGSPVVGTVNNEKHARTPEALKDQFAIRAVHSSSDDITRVDPTKFGSREDPGYYGEGFYMYPHDYAVEHGTGKPGGTFYGVPKEGAYPRNYLLNLDTKNPFHIDNGKADWESLKPHGWEHGDVPAHVWENDEAMDKARENAPQEVKDALSAAGDKLAKAQDDLYSLYDARGKLKPDAPKEQVESLTEKYKAAMDEEDAARAAAHPAGLLAKQFTKAVLDAGHDAIIISTNGKPQEMVGIKPGTLSTTFGDEPMYALHGFYNPATRAVEESKQASMPGEQWLKMLQGAGQKGVQKRHLEELGVQDFLEGKGKVTKQDLLDHMRINEAPLEEKVLGKYVESPETKNAREHNNRVHEDVRDINDKIYDIEAKMRDLPEDSAEWNNLNDEADKLFDEANRLRSTRLPVPSDESTHQGPKFSQHSPFPEGNNAQEFIIRDPRFSGQYDEPHYGGPVALHIRTWDLNGPNDEKILGVGEIQSTLHQRGRSEGYDLRFTEEDEKRLKELGPIRDRLEREYNATPNYDELSNEEKDRLYQPLRDVYREIDRLDALQSRESIPKAALSDSWLDVGMKRALQYAAENGYDGVTWAKAEQIAHAVGAEPEALETDYNKKIPSFFQKIAKKYGAGSGSIEIKGSVGPHNIDDFGLTDDAIRHIQSEEYNLGHAITQAKEELDEFRKDGTPSEIHNAERVISELQDFAAYAKTEIRGDSNDFIRINDKMRQDVTEKGLPMARTPERAVEMMKAALDDGKSVAVSKAAMSEVHDSIANVRHILPEDIGVHALAKIEPRDDGRLTAVFRDVSGNDLRLTADTLSDLTNLRGFCLNNGANICIPNFFASGDAAKGGPASGAEVGAPDTHGGVFLHESVHSLLRRGLIPADDWSRLVDHANHLKVLDMPMHEYLGAIGEDVKPGPDTLRDNYKLAYQNYAKEDVNALLNEEEPVAHMMELFHHRHFTGDQMQPIADLLGKFVGGGYAKGDAAPKSAQGETLEGAQSALEKSVKELYASEFPNKDVEDFGTHGWWALGTGKSSYGDQDVLNRLKEKHPDLVSKYHDLYKSSREDRLRKSLEESTK